MNHLHLVVAIHAVLIHVGGAEAPGRLLALVHEHLHQPDHAHLVRVHPVRAGPVEHLGVEGHPVLGVGVGHELQRDISHVAAGQNAPGLGKFVRRREPPVRVDVAELDFQHGHQLDVPVVVGRLLAVGKPAAHAVVEEGLDAALGVVGHRPERVIPLDVALCVPIHPREHIERVPEAVGVARAQLKLDKGGFACGQPFDHQVHGLGFVELIERAAVLG